MNGDTAASPVSNGQMLNDLRERLDNAETNLVRLARDTTSREVDRLLAKADGVALARSYVDEYLREMQAWRDEVLALGCYRCGHEASLIDPCDEECEGLPPLSWTQMQAGLDNTDSPVPS